MKNTIKELLKSTVISIGMALTIFCLIGVIFAYPQIRLECSDITKHTILHTIYYTVFVKYSCEKNKYLQKLYYLLRKMSI